MRNQALSPTEMDHAAARRLRISPQLARDLRLTDRRLLGELGLEERCPICHGHGEIDRSADAWERYDRAGGPMPDLLLDVVTCDHCRGHGVVPSAVGEELLDFLGRWSRGGDR